MSDKGLIMAPIYPGKEFFGIGNSNGWIGVLRLKLRSLKNPSIDRMLTNRPTCGTAADWLVQLKQEQEWDDRIEGACIQFQLLLGLRGSAVDGIPDEYFWDEIWQAQ